VQRAGCSAARVVLFMILKFKWITVAYIPQFLVLLLSQAFALYQRFAALEVHKQRTVALFNYLTTIDRKYKFSHHLLLLCYSADQALIVM